MSVAFILRHVIPDSIVNVEGKVSKETDYQVKLTALLDNPIQQLYSFT